MMRSYFICAAKRRILVAHWVFMTLIACLSGCGGDSGGGGGGGGTSEVEGTLKGLTSDLTENSGWSVVFSERDTGLCTIGKIGPAGKYKLVGVRAGMPMTALLLDVNFKLRSVLSFPGLETGQIRQFFTFGGPTLPALVHQGGVIKFSDASSLNILEDWAYDRVGTAGDGIPDGMDQTTTASLALHDLALADDDIPEIDTDQDETLNQFDPDIDGDGIVNRFDWNQDGDPNDVQNIFSADANGNLVEDVLEENTESFFPESVEYFVVQVIQKMVKSGGFETYLNFTVKLRGGGPDKVNIRGSEKLLTGANLIAIDANSGAETASVWDYSLRDDGLSGDSAAKDLIYAAQVLLADEALPSPGEVVFASLQFGKEVKTARFIDFPYIFPDIGTNAVTPSVSGQTVTLTLANNPFLVSGATDGSRDYYWSVQLFDESLSPREKVFNSDPFDISDLDFTATTANYTIPVGAVAKGAYKAYVVLQAKGMRLPGMPLWTIVSNGSDLTVTK